MGRIDKQISDCGDNYVIRKASVLCCSYLKSFSKFFSKTSGFQSIVHEIVVLLFIIRNEIFTLVLPPVSVALASQRPYSNLSRCRQLTIHEDFFFIKKKFRDQKRKTFNKKYTHLLQKKSKSTYIQPLSQSNRLITNHLLRWRQRTPQLLPKHPLLLRIRIPLQIDPRFQQIPQRRRHMTLTNRPQLNQH